MNHLNPESRNIPYRLLIGLVTLALTSELLAADPYETAKKLPSRYGYLVIDTVIGRSVTKWQLNSGLTIDRLPLGRQTILVRLPAGTYYWRQINIPYFDLPHRVDLYNDRRWKFTVQRQKINYAGTLIVDEKRGSDSAGVRFVNRSSQIIALLQKDYSTHLDQLGIIFSGGSRDDFLKLSLGDDASAIAE